MGDGEGAGVYYWCSAGVEDIDFVRPVKFRNIFTDDKILHIFLYIPNLAVGGLLLRYYLFYCRR